LSEPVQIRPAGREDVGTVFALISALADYERLSDRLRGNEQLLAEGLFGPNATAEALIAEIDSEPVGFALFFHTFSTFECRRGIWLEDLFVYPERRREGVGRALLSHLARIALERECARLEWVALDWNEPALRFYDALGAQRLDTWKTLRLDGESLDRLAGVGAENA
jgi:GNAT superfamily N-acetyltransferase